jgi:hypothetical protein
MDDKINLLITMTDGVQLFLVALKLNGDALTEDERTYFLEPENKAQLMSLLPLHCQSLGSIVEVQELFHISDHSLTT